MFGLFPGQAGVRSPTPRRVKAMITFWELVQLVRLVKTHRAKVKEVGDSDLGPCIRHSLAYTMAFDDYKPCRALMNKCIVSACRYDPPEFQTVDGDRLMLRGDVTMFHWSHNISAACRSGGREPSGPPNHRVYQARGRG